MSAPTSLARRRCLPCSGKIPRLARAEAARLLRSLASGWRIRRGRLLRDLQYGDFAAPFSLAKRIGALAEREGHHPDLFLRWGLLRIVIWTHKIGGLTVNDFILAAKIDRLAAAGASKPETRNPKPAL